MAEAAPVSCDAVSTSRLPGGIPTPSRSSNFLTRRPSESTIIRELAEITSTSNSVKLRSSSACRNTSGQRSKLRNADIVGSSFQ